MGLKKLTPAAVKYLVVHCSATQPKADIGVAEIDKMHRERGFNGIGYHFVIRRDGTVEKGRPEDQIGAHVEGHNSESIGICLVGGINKEGKAEDNFTLDQYASLAALLMSLASTYTEATVLGHRDFPGVKKDCPCFDVRKWVQETINAPEVGS